VPTSLSFSIPFSGDPQLRHGDMAHPEQPRNGPRALTLSQAPGRLFALVIIMGLRTAAVGPAGLGMLDALEASTPTVARSASILPSRPSIEYVDVVDGILGGTRGDRSHLLTAAKALRFPASCG